MSYSSRKPSLFALLIVSMLIGFATHAHAATAQGQYKGLSFSMGYATIVGGGTHVHFDNVTSDLSGVETCTAFMHKDTKQISGKGMSADAVKKYYAQFEGKIVKLGNIRLFEATPRDTFCLFDTLSIVE